MKKTNFFYAAAIALVSAFGMTSCSVEDNPASDPTQPQPAEPTIVEVSLQDVPFYTVNKDADGDAAFGKDAKTTGEGTPIWVVGESTGQPYGDGSVNCFSDLSGYTKLIVVATDGIPRIMLNRSKVEGQFNENEAESALIEYPKCESSWAGKYFSVEDVEGGKQYTVDLAQLVADKGYAHLHAIKGANWNNTTVTSMIVEKVEE